MTLPRVGNEQGQVFTPNEVRNESTAFSTEGVEAASLPPALFAHERHQNI